MVGSLLLAVLTAGLADISAVEPVRLAFDRTLAIAERDFDLSREELGLAGAAPLFGLEEPAATESAAPAKPESKQPEQAPPRS